MSNGKSKNPPAKGPSPAANRPPELKPGVAPAGKPGVPAAQPAKAAGSAQPVKTAVPAQPPVPVHVPPLYRRIDWFSFIVTFVVVCAGYLWTLAPDLTLEDCGELATGSFYAGVPHPPGYPVWTVYSWVFTWLVPIGNVAYRVAISSAFAGALACGLVALMVSRGSSMIMEGIADLRNIEKRFENALCLVCGFVAGVVIGFNGFMWSQAVIVEVYTLSVLSMTGVLACMLRWVYAPHQRRYLYMAFFWFGICFNNHQSLIVIVLGMEIAVLFAAPRLARNLFFWNTVCYLGGLFLKGLGMVTTLSDNPPLLLIYHLIGIGSFIIWVSLLVSTRITGMEFIRDFLLVAALGYLGVLFLSVTNNVTTFEYKPGLYAAFNTAGLGLLAVTAWVIGKTWKLPREWLPALGCGGAFATGAAFYVFMPLASMSNPPLNWGYARTVQGFFHAFTRGQYERIHPTTKIGTYIDQVQLYIGGAFEEMNFVYVLLGLVPLFFLRKMQARERAWLIGLAATYVTLSALLLWLLNPAPDRQSRDLNRVFFTASHFIIAMGLGYGLAILGGYLSLHYQRFRNYCLFGSLGAAFLALFMLAVRFSGAFRFQSPVVDLDASYNPIVRFTCVFSLCLALAGVVMFLVSRTQLPRIAFLAVLWVMPAWSVLSHWYDNEQRGHYFGYWFGHDMFAPPFYDAATRKLSYDSKRRAELLGTPEGRHVYPEMDRDTVLYGGTDPGRFNPTYMIFCESFVPPSKRNPMNPGFDRRDVYLITQNALADGTYLNYIRAQFNRTAQIDPPFFSELFRGPKELANELEKPNHTNIVARLMRPLDHYFLENGYKIEERRRTETSLFTEKDFADLPRFAGKLKTAADPVSKFLFENISKETQQLLTSGKESALRAALAKDLSALLRRDLDAWRKLDQLQEQKLGLTNAITAAKADLAGGPSGDTVGKLKSNIAKWENTLAPIDKAIAELQAIPSLYESNRFAGVQLTPRTKRFIKENPRSHTRIRLNRILLEEAYPTELAKSIGGVYPDLEILSATNDDSQRCFQEYLQDAQKRLEHDRRYPTEPRQIRAGEDVQIRDNRVQVSGQVAVMAINGLLTKVIFDKNPDHEFYVEESFPLDWMYPHLSPFGIIMKINRNPVPEITDDMVYRDHEFWSQFSTRLIGNWITYDTTVSEIVAFADEAYYKHRVPTNFTGDRRFLRDSDGQKAFSKLRSSIAGVYNWRISTAKSPQEQQRMIKEADFAFKQAYAFCPYSPEAIFRYVNLLVQLQRIDDALRIAETSFRLDPFNGQIENLIVELTRIKGSMSRAGGAEARPSAAVPQDQINALEAHFKARPSDLNAGMQLATVYVQAQQFPKAIEVLDQVLTNPAADANMLTVAANYYAQMGAVGKIEHALQLLVKQTPDNPEGRFDLAAILAVQNKTTQALESLSNALQQNAARLKRDTAAPNIYSSATTDTRLASLRGLPEFQRIVDTFKPK